jgi:hypothetical protein
MPPLALNPPAECLPSETFLGRGAEPAVVVLLPAAVLVPVVSPEQLVKQLV